MIEFKPICGPYGQYTIKIDSIAAINSDYSDGYLFEEYCDPASHPVFLCSCGDIELDPNTYQPQTKCFLVDDCGEGRWCYIGVIPGILHDLRIMHGIKISLSSVLGIQKMTKVEILCPHPRRIEYAVDEWVKSQVSE